MTALVQVFRQRLLRKQGDFTPKPRLHPDVLTATMAFTAFDDKSRFLATAPTMLSLTSETVCDCLITAAQMKGLKKLHCCNLKSHTHSLIYVRPTRSLKKTKKLFHFN